MAGQAHARWHHRSNARHGVVDVGHGATLLFRLLALLQQRGIELVQVLWHHVRVHLDQWEAVRMALEVDLQVSLGGEPVAADVTLVGPLACV